MTHSLNDKQRDRQGFAKVRKPAGANDSYAFLCVGVSVHDPLCFGHWSLQSFHSTAVSSGKSYTVIFTLNVSFWLFGFFVQEQIRAAYLKDADFDALLRKR